MQRYTVRPSVGSRFARHHPFHSIPSKVVSRIPSPPLLCAFRFRPRGHPALSRIPTSSPLVTRDLAVLIFGRTASTFLAAFALAFARLGSLLDADVQALPPQRLQQCARSSHAWEILRGVHAEDIGDDARNGSVNGTLLHVHGVDPQELEVQSIPARGPTTEIWEDEESTCDTVFVLCLVRAGYEGAHQSACGLHVRACWRDLCLVRVAIGVEQSAV